MALVLIFIVKTGIECWINPTFLFFVFIAGIHVIEKVQNILLAMNIL